MAPSDNIDIIGTISSHNQAIEIHPSIVASYESMSVSVNEETMKKKKRKRRGKG